MLKLYELDLVRRGRFAVALMMIHQWCPSVEEEPCFCVVCIVRIRAELEDRCRMAIYRDQSDNEDVHRPMNNVDRVRFRLLFPALMHRNYGADPVLDNLIYNRL